MSGRRGRASQTRYDCETRAQALALADEHGAEEASRRTGIAAGTIRRWRHETGRVTTPRGVDAATWAERKRVAADETWAAARDALARVRELLARGDGRSERDAKDAALTLAILLDKSTALEEAAERAAERSAKLADAQIDALAAALNAFLDDLRLPRTPEVIAVLAHHLRPLEHPAAPTGPAPTAALAAEALRVAVRDEMQPEPRSDAAMRALPSSGRARSARTASRSRLGADECELGRVRASAQGA